jgi:methylphosphotriester-DNA--protein-cysteine methyltransferase
MRASDWVCPHCHVIFETPTTRREHEGTCRKDPQRASAFDRQFLRELGIRPDEETHERPAIHPAAE